MADKKGPLSLGSEYASILWEWWWLLVVVAAGGVLWAVDFGLHFFHKTLDLPKAVPPIVFLGGLFVAQFVAFAKMRTQRNAAENRLLPRFEALPNHEMRRDQFWGDGGLQAEWHRVVVQSISVDPINNAKVYLRRFGGLHDRMIDCVPTGTDGTRIVSLDHEVPRAFDLFTYDAQTDNMQLVGREGHKITFQRSACPETFELTFSVSGNGTKTRHYSSTVIPEKSGIVVFPPNEISDPTYTVDSVPVANSPHGPNAIEPTSRPSIQVSTGADDSSDRALVIATFTTHEAVSASDPDGEPFELDYIRFQNVGKETALGITLEPIKLPHHDATLWDSTISILPPSSKPVDRQIKGGLQTEMQRARKALGLDYMAEVRVPLWVSYHDGKGPLRTRHAAILKGNDFRIDHLHSEPPFDYWTKFD